MLRRAEEYIEKLKGRKIRVICAVLASLGLFLVSFHYLYHGMNKRFLIFTALCLLTGVFLACPRLEDRRLCMLAAVLYLIFVPGRIFLRIEIPVHDMGDMLDGAALANIMVILLIYAILLLIFRRVCVALGGGGIVLMLFSLLNYYVYQSWGGGLSIGSWTAVMTALPIWNSRQPLMSEELWYSILYFCFFIAFGFWCDVPAREAKYRRMTMLLPIAYCAFFLIFWNSGYLEKHMLRPHYENVWADEALNGALLGFGIRRTPPEQEAWYKRFPTVCHALGETKEGDTLTNSLEALEYNYRAGQRVFEADIAIASDQVAVLRHDWNSDLGQAESFGWTEDEQRTPTSEEFMAVPIYGKYTPMTLLQLYKVMDERQDMYVVIDPKYHSDVAWQFSVIVDTALDNGYESVLDRVIVQIYYEQMYEAVESVYHFENYLYTLYYIGHPGAESVGTFCEKNNIPVLVMPYTWIGDRTCGELQAYGLRVYVHTVNEAEEAEQMVSMGVDGLYSDDIVPGEVKRLLLRHSRADVLPDAR